MSDEKEVSDGPFVGGVVVCEYDNPRDSFLKGAPSTTEQFHIGNSVYDGNAIPLACARCDGDTFNVGKADYRTVIRCVQCRWEYGIHDG